MNNLLKCSSSAPLAIFYFLDFLCQVKGGVLYSLRIVESKLIKAQEFLYISDYVDADEPMYGSFYLNREEVNEVWQVWKENIESLKDIKHELMSLQDLLEKLEEQNRII